MNMRVALLRGINVGGHNRIPMADLRELCSEIGWEEVATYIQSGNIVFASDREARTLEDELQAAIRDRFGHDVHTLVRTGREWTSLLSSNPFPEASEAEANRVMLGLSKAPLDPRAAEALQARATADESVEQRNGALWLYFPNGSARSKLTPVALDRLAGSPVTTRNWRTVVKLQATLQDR
ncbi:MAG: DUF1697 domain-containing protein [Wenzhouxiangella sp.]|jgi:uncharacterized protein (DUF1697 family)|nr:DUF1697 domain-containing protein [Wenzhouxiangella sp.]